MANRQLLIEQKFWEDFQYWLVNNRKIMQRIFDLAEESSKSPFSGTGKPEPLKSNFKGYWSRRIDADHRLIYKVTDDYIILVSCKGHY
jgi:toxin YoeB